jgi:hypothetical protein
LLEYEETARRNGYDNQLRLIRLFLPPYHKKAACSLIQRRKFDQHRRYVQCHLPFESSMTDCAGSLQGVVPNS